LDLDCLSDCGYTSGSEWSDDESLLELDGGDLDLKGLRAETLLDKLSQPKTSVVWKMKQSRTGLSDTMAFPVERSAGGIR